jgi:1,2-diacylglycerol 3-alpha-glucosyltransferase
MNDLANNNPVVLVCTGLGRAQRGFEMYTSSLAGKLSQMKLAAPFEVWTGGAWKSENIISKKINGISRNNILLKGLANGFTWEQRSFAISMFRQLIKQNPAVIYLGEYQLYCWLYKIRKLLGLKFSLVLYTGGQALPGLFDPSKDFVHHVTDFYLHECGHIPGERQFVVPHFFEDDFVYNAAAIQKIKERAAGKKIVLSVGLLDKTVKRMDLLVRSLSPLKDAVFPVLLGDNTNDTGEIRNMLEENFGKEGYIMGKVSHPELGNYYKAADLFVLCSPKESFGLAYIEALFHGLPVIADDFKEARYVMKDQAEFVNMKDEAALTLAINNALLQESCVELREKRTAFSMSNYSWETVGPAYKNMFRKFLKN